MDLQPAGLWQALAQENPLQIVGTLNAYTALLAKRAGFKAIYLSGAGVANYAFGIPDLGITNSTDVANEVWRITDACDLPLLVDIDTGWGSFFNIQRTIKQMIKAGAAGVHLEDQVAAKRCGHRPNKALVDTNEMCDRIKAAVDAIHDPNFTLMARTDALAAEGIDKTIARILRYVDAGAQMIFFEGATTLAEYQAVTTACPQPVLANITEFGMTPLFTKTELQQAGVQLILYPLSAARAMAKAATDVYGTIREQDTQAPMLDKMQTRPQLYDVLNYHAYEQKLDELFEKENTK